MQLTGYSQTWNKPNAAYGVLAGMESTCLRPTGTRRHRGKLFQPNGVLAHLRLKVSLAISALLRFEFFNKPVLQFSSLKIRLHLLVGFATKGNRLQFFIHIQKI